MRTHKRILSMTITALMVGVGLFLPFLLGQVQVLMQGISPMHIPVFLCGLTCGPLWGLLAGSVLPLLRSILFGMPVFPAVAVPMAFELGVYGLITGLIYRMILHRTHMPHWPAMLISLLTAMLAGRVVGGIAKALLMLGMNSGSYSLSMFVNAYFIGTAVGAVIHLILVPLITLSVEAAKLSPLTMKD